MIRLDKNLFVIFEFVNDMLCI